MVTEPVVRYGYAGWAKGYINQTILTLGEGIVIDPYFFRTEQPDGISVNLAQRS